MPPKFRSHCINGHKRTSENTYVSQSNKRHCLICATARDRAKGKLPRDEYLRLRIESGVKRRAAEDKEAKTVVPLVKMFISVNWPVAAGDYLPRPFYRRHAEIYLANVALGWNFARIARHYNSTPTWVREVTHRVEDTRDHLEVDEAFNLLEEKLKMVIADAHK